MNVPSSLKTWWSISATQNSPFSAELTRVHRLKFSKFFLDFCCITCFSTKCLLRFLNSFELVPKTQDTGKWNLHSVSNQLLRSAQTCRIVRFFSLAFLVLDGPYLKILFPADFKWRLLQSPYKSFYFQFSDWVYYFSHSFRSSILWRFGFFAPWSCFCYSVPSSGTGLKTFTVVGLICLPNNWKFVI